jgi:spermidine synthase
VAALLLASGFCALIYQTVWMRELRLVFGASTLAVAAVLAIFMGGIGCGAAILGRRADAHARPLAFYGMLECGIAVSAALTPFLLDAVRALYVAAGGSVALGDSGATLLRLALTAVVLGVPTFLMGGTLSAASRATGRTHVALLYAMNTAGAVAGVLLASFFLLERLGNRNTLFLAAALNAIVGLAAFRTPTSAPAGPEASRVRPRPRTIPLVAAALSGLVFLLMELVWYRMLSPILGGTTFMFALVLAIALAGIGIGGALFAAHGARLRTHGHLAIFFALEAAALALPYALGDRIALLAHSLGDGGAFFSHVADWTLVTAIVVLPAAILSGVQFPLLIALLGENEHDTGRDVGLAYAWNTAGAIAGSLLGGFGLIPLLGATGCWRLSVALLAAMAMLFAWRAQRTSHVAWSALTGAIAIAMLFTTGPTAVWRHSGIGAERVPTFEDANAARAWMQTVRRTLVFDRDGRESSIALVNHDDLGLIVNGKSDGSARADAGTQVMGGLLGALLHGNAKTAMVVGLGTGTTAGWLADVPTMQRVDVVELEPAVVELARAYAPVNRNAVEHPKVHIRIGDAREQLVVTRTRYDVIFSEPSNPYRAGIASLYTREFYAAVRDRLARGGVFVQWVQTYSIDARTARTIYATLATAFPNIQTWTTGPGDIVLVASREPLPFDVAQMRARLAAEPFRTAAHVAWRAESVEGILARFVAGEGVARAYAKEARELNTDDRSVIEFGFARTVGRDLFGTNDIANGAKALRSERPARLAGNVDWNRVASDRASLAYLSGANDFAKAYAAAEFDRAMPIVPDRPVSSRQVAAAAHVLALAGDTRAESFANELRAWQPIEADAVLGILRARQQRSAEAAQLLANALIRYRENPWPMHGIMESALIAATQLDDPSILDAVSRPFAARQIEETRRVAAIAIAWRHGRCGARTLQALSDVEPHAPWAQEILQLRALCYETVGLPENAERAKRDLSAFESGAGRAATSSSARSVRASPRP